MELCDILQSLCNFDPAFVLRNHCPIGNAIPQYDDLLVDFRDQLLYFLYISFP